MCGVVGYTGHRDACPILVFKSTTDSEVLVQFIEFIMESEGVGLLSAVQSALGRVIGSYAIAVIDRESPKTIIAARKSSPLVIGRGDHRFDPSDKLTTCRD